jgi:voltage-dependent anion channel protein 2
MVHPTPHRLPCAAARAPLLASSADLLGKDYDVGKTKVEVKMKSANGITFTPIAEKKGETPSGSLAAKYNIMPWLEGEATVGTNGSLELTLEACDAITKGLVLKAECAKAAPDKNALLASANLIAEYKSDLFSCKTSYDCYKNDLLASATTAFSDVTAGIDCSYCVNKGAVTKYACAAQFVQPDFTAATKYEAKGGKGTLSCSYFHKVSGDMQLGVAVAKPLAKPDMSIEFGCAYKLDKDTSVKAKVDSDGVMCTSYKQKISSLTTMTLAAQVDTVNLADNKHKFGLQLNITP